MEKKHFSCARCSAEFQSVANHAKYCMKCRAAIQRERVKRGKQYCIGDKKTFTVSGWYDPFKDLTNGIYEISSDEYADFNRGRGIYSNGCNYPGKLFMLKKNGFYMFALQSQSSLCLLAGGQRKKLPIKDVQYYYDRMDLYAMKVMEAVAPFQKALSVIADEVRRFGGDGYVHGCIVDIDFYNHIYLNPVDGTITPYFALDIQNKYVYTDVISLLKKRSPELCQRYQSEKRKGSLPLLGQFDGKGKKKKATVAKVPKLVLETDIYIASRTMKAIQYVSNIESYESGTKTSLLLISVKLHKHWK